MFLEYHNPHSPSQSQVPEPLAQINRRQRDRRRNELGGGLSVLLLGGNSHEKKMKTKSARRENISVHREKQTCKGQKVPKCESRELCCLEGLVSDGGRV